ncbi:MAG: hypothetical protein KatS3mg033_0086 [Thermonema sp.]|uniref:DUF1207 domain-containing protein n=1 Tax=Thermonema sp. TaxID=2231181 RepID=UPI0021DEA499|nr:DUF1207 domain-containing protein [Thermonema sp.]GIV38286.1 MAG: hypothetical protein KatS3mg033_0086 [Thermonema sp.]
MKRLPVTLVAFCVVFLCSCNVFAQTVFFKKRTFNAPLYADHYAPLTRIGFSLMPAKDDYDIRTEKSRFVLYNEPVLGVALPLAVHRSPRWQWALSIPISFSVWFDFLEARTSPILNTDYRVGVLEWNAFFELSGVPFRNIGIRWVPLFHESTHLGDELTIERLRNALPITRINVSYEVMDLAFLLNQPRADEQNHMFVLGARILWDARKGWYRADPLESDTSKVPPSRRSAEPYFQYQWQKPSSFWGYGGLWVLSVDMSLRVRYGYPWYEKRGSLWIEHARQEAYEPCMNLLAGYRWRSNDGSLSNTFTYMRLYWGINYHGQFRNLGNFPVLGVGVIYRP